MQASEGHYSEPREDDLPATAYSLVEVGYVRDAGGNSIEVTDWAENYSGGEFCYYYVPSKEVETFIEYHGGVVPSPEVSGATA